MDCAAVRIASRCEQLVSRGWDLIDDCLNTDCALSLAAECSKLEGNGCLRAHCFEFEGPTKASYEHPGRRFTDLPCDKAERLSEIANRVAPELAKELQAKMPQLQLTGQSQVKILGNRFAIFRLHLGGEPHFRVSLVDALSFFYLL